MDTKRDKFLTEAMGECWHETFFREYGLTIETIRGEFIEKNCTCGRITRIGKSYSAKDQQPLCSNQSFSSWEGFGKLWEFCQKQKWWKIGFKANHWGVLETHIEFIPDLIIHPDLFADAVYEYLREVPK